MKIISIGCLFWLLLNGLQGQGIVVDHNSIELFDSIPEQYKDAAAQLHMIFMDRSVGGNIDEYLNCLASPWSSARSFCKKYDHRDSNYAVSPTEVFWNGIWDRSHWRYEYWPTACSEDVQCFIDFMQARMDSFDVMGCQFSYLAVTPGSKIADPVNGFFGSKISRNHASVYSKFATDNPNKKIIWWTSSMARGIGTPESEAFNHQMRSYTQKNQLILFDVADILSHNPDGIPCYDNRDGIAYLTENYPDDGLNIPAICPQYTTETEGGHLGSISAGGIRVAKAFWVLMAQIAGWQKITSKAEEFESIKINYFPVPSRDELIFNIKGLNSNNFLEFSIFDLNGHLLKFQTENYYVNPKPNELLKIPLHELENGMYIFKVKIGNFVKSMKIVVLH